MTKRSKVLLNPLPTIFRYPKNVKVEDKWLFEKARETVNPAVNYFRLNNILATAQGYYFEGYILSKKAFPLEIGLKYVFRYFIKAYLERFTSPIKKEEITSAFVCSDFWSHGYYHWLAEAVPRIYLVKDKINKDNPLLLPAKYEQIPFIMEYLQVFGIPYVFIPDSEGIRIRHLQLVSHTTKAAYFRPDLIQQVRKSILGQLGLKEHIANRKIYISRKNAIRRKLLNESALLPVLAEFGYDILNLEQYNWQKQVEICSRAKIMIGLHGAGLTNMLFMSSDSNVVELRRENDDYHNCYFTMSSALNHNYYYLMCEMVANDEEKNHYDVLVDPEKFRKLLLELN